MKFWCHYCQLFTMVSHQPFFVAKPLDIDLPKLGVFGALVWIKEVPMELIRIELLFYKQIAMPDEASNPLSWWVE